MRVSTKVQEVNRHVSVSLDGTLSPEEQSKLLGDIALQELKAAQEVNRAALGLVPDHEVWVDSRKGASVYTVRPKGGQIIFEFALVEDVVVWIGEQLTKHSPFRSGRYTASHVLFADDELIEEGRPIPEAEQYIYLNIQPYARKIERGLSPQAPEGVYQSVAALARRRFGNVASISYGFSTPLFGAIDAWASRTSMPSPGRRGAKREDWLRRQPAIFIFTG